MQAGGAIIVPNHKSRPMERRGMDGNRPVVSEAAVSDA